MKPTVSIITAYCSSGNLIDFWAVSSVMNSLSYDWRVEPEHRLINAVLPALVYPTKAITGAVEWRYYFFYLKWFSRFWRTSSSFCNLASRSLIVYCSMDSWVSPEPPIDPDFYPLALLIYTYSIWSLMRLPSNIFPIFPKFVVPPLISIVLANLNHASSIYSYACLCFALAANIWRIIPNLSMTRTFLNSYIYRCKLLYSSLDNSMLLTSVSDSNSVGESSPFWALFRKYLRILSSFSLMISLNLFSSFFCCIEVSVVFT